MSRREQILLISALLIVMAVGYYLLAYQPLRAANAQLTQDYEIAKKELDRLQAIAKQREQLEQKYAQLQGFIASVEAKLPTMKEVPTLLVQLERLARSLSIKLQGFRPGALEPVAAGTPTPPAAGGTTPAGGTAQAPKPAPVYYRFPIKLSVNANYSQVLQLMSQLRDFPRLIRVKRLGVSPKTLPELNLDVDVDTYVLPKEGG